MAGELRVDAPELIVYIDYSDVDRAHLDELREGIRRVVDFVEARQPQLLAYGFHLDEDAGRMTVTAVHPDSASLELHLEVGREAFRTLGRLITLRAIHVYGSISERAHTMLEEKAAMLGGANLMVSEPLASFTRRR